MSQLTDRMTFEDFETERFNSLTNEQKLDELQAQVIEWTLRPTSTLAEVNVITDKIKEVKKDIEADQMGHPDDNHREELPWQ